MQLRHTVDFGHYGLPGLKLMSWVVQGWGADASAMAANSADPASSPYWKNGRAVHGKHWEVGVVPTYVIPRGHLKGSSVSLKLMYHRAPAHYSDPGNKIVRLVMNMPVSIF